MRGWRWSLPAAALIFSACAGDGDQQPSAELERATERDSKVDGEQLKTELQNLLAAEKAPEGLALSDEDWAGVKAHYQARDHQPVWVDRKGPRGQARDLLGALCTAEEDGLVSTDYDVKAIEQALAAVRAAPKDPKPLAAAELKITTLFLHYAKDLSLGRIPPKKAAWNIDGRELDAKMIFSTLGEDSKLEDALAKLRPAHPEYAKLRDALKKYREVEAKGGWPDIPKGKTLEPGAKDPRIALVRQRLQVTGELDAGTPADPNHYDDALVEAVKKFQARHGLEEDAKIGGETLATLKVPVSRRIDQLIVNMERWRWMPDDLGERSVLVNIPAFDLQLREGAKVIEQMRVIVGLPDWETPVFSSHIEAVIFKPQWSVPKKILSDEILPKMQEDSSFAAKTGLRIYSKEDGSEIDPASVDWVSVDPKAGPVPYKFQQPAGEDNPLGHVKFMMPNRYAIYLHDTPSDKLFQKAYRSFSHGCVRVERPVELAEWVLSGTEGWTHGEVQAEFEGKTKGDHVPPAKPPKVYLTYFSSFVADDGTVQFRTDLYDWDAALIRLLKKAAPATEEKAPLCG